MLKFNICFIKRNNEILLLNRDKPSWMGAWNGVGGKLDQNETPRDSIRREVYEETGLKLDTIIFKGFVTWDVDENYYGGMYLYLAEMDQDIPYMSPVKTDEGILDWKTTDWILHPENVGIATHLPLYLPILLEDERCFNHHSIFRNDKLTDLISKPIGAEYENYSGDLIHHFKGIGII
jgi:8-oxo-dGTP diphosphatase